MLVCIQIFSIFLGVLLMFYVVSLVKHCEELDVPMNGRKSSNDTGCDSIVDFSCSECYQLVGSSQVTCYPNGSWSGDEPTCEC